MPTSSARPARLRTYAKATVERDRRLQAEALGELRVTLDRFRRSRSEFGSIGDVEIDLAAHADAASDLDAWVGRVAIAFENADGAVGWGKRVADDDAVAEAIPASFDLPSRLVAATRQQWANLLLGRNDECIAGPGTYAGGGMVIGPDGLEYPLAVPTLFQDGVPYHGNRYAISDADNVATLGGTDTGWVTVHIESGVHRIQEEISNWLKPLVFIAGMNPNIRPVFPPASTDVLGALSVGPDGVPMNGVAPRPPGVAVGGGPASKPTSPVLVQVDGRLIVVDRISGEPMNREIRRGPVNVAPPPAYTRLEAARAGLSLAKQIGGGVTLLQQVDAGSFHSYQVVFEVHPDGRRRAMLRTYGVRYDVDGTPIVFPNTGYLDPEGDLVLDHMRFLDGGPVMSAAPPEGTTFAPFRVVQFDVELTDAIAAARN